MTRTKAAIWITWSLSPGHRTDIEGDPDRQAAAAGHIGGRNRQRSIFPRKIIEKGSGFFSQSWLGVPILAGDQALGILALSDARPNAFNEDNLRLMQTLATGMSVTIENARLFEAEQQRAAELAAVNTVSSALVSELNLEALINLVGEQTRAIFNADIAYVALLDESHGLITFPYTYGEDLTTIRMAKD